MSDFQRKPGSIDDPGMKGGAEPHVDALPPGDTAGDIASEEPGTPVMGREGVKVGSVEGMLGTEAESIFHGIALRPATGGPTRVIPADVVTSLTTSGVEVQLSVDEVERLPNYDQERS